jgi:hypothetical protein
MVSAVVLTDFAADGVTYQQGQKIRISKDQYDEWEKDNLVGPGSDPTATSNLVGPGSEDK